MLNEGLAAAQRTLNNLVVEKPLKPFYHQLKLDWL